MSSTDVLQRLQLRASQADDIISSLKAQLNGIKAVTVADVCKAEEIRLQAENEKLRKEVEKLKAEIIVAEIRNGVKQVALPTQGQASSAAAQVAPPPAAAAVAPSQVEAKPKPQQQQKKEKKKGDNKPSTAGPTPAAPVDVSRVDMRIGRIVNVKKHPEADSLYVEEVDLAEGKNRTIVSGLVKHVSIEEMQDCLAIFTCNLKPAKMRGILSEGMIMCGSSPEKVEIIIPPPGVKPGDRVYVEGYTGMPDALMNPKKKIFEQVQPEFSINAEGVATYRNVPWKVEGHEELCTVPTMRGTGIK